MSEDFAEWVEREKQRAAEERKGWSDAMKGITTPNPEYEGQADG